jgi:lysophospholipase L1-like esterase
MNVNNLEFVNVAELETIPHLSGIRLQRFPASVRHQLGYQASEKGRLVAERSVGCEIRFVTDAKHIRMTLSSVEGDGMVLVYKGDFFHSKHQLNKGMMTTIDCEEPERFNWVDVEHLKGKRFSNNVWRFVFGKDSLITFYHLNSFGHVIRKPNASEKPSYTLLSYGSSITSGSGAVLYSNAYIYQTAERLNLNVINKGMSGTCFLEPVMADYLAELDFDIATLEIGVNVRGKYTKEEFAKRANYLVDTLIKNHPNKPIVLIGLFPNYSSHALDKNQMAVQNMIVYPQILKEIVEAKNDSYLHYIDGNAILTDFSYLTSDLIHPSDYGHIRMGEELSLRLRPIIEQQVIKK